MKKVLNEIFNFKTFPLLIAIDGLSGSGKTTLAQELQKSYPEIQRVEMDHFCLPLSKRTPFHHQKSAHEEYDYERLQNEILIPFKKGIKTYYYKYNWVTDTIEQEKFTIDPNRPLILEGATALHPGLQNAIKFDYTIWVESPSQTRIERAKKRDDAIAQELGGYNEETRDYFFQKWLPMENNYFQKYRPDQKANITVEN